jgi:hypothetical protein
MPEAAYEKAVKRSFGGRRNGISACQPETWEVEMPIALTSQHVELARTTKVVRHEASKETVAKIRNQDRPEFDSKFS